MKGKELNVTGKIIIDNDDNTIGFLNTASSTSNTVIPQTQSELMDTIVYDDRVELIYKETEMFAFTANPVQYPEPKVYKVVYSCKKGKFHESERIYGHYLKPSGEGYSFPIE